MNQLGYLYHSQECEFTDVADTAMVNVGHNSKRAVNAEKFYIMETKTKPNFANSEFLDRWKMI